MRGLAVVAADGGDKGLEPERGGGEGEEGLGKLIDGNGLPVTSLNSAALGFHDERWKLFFFRTLALYAARIAAVACEGLM